MSSALSILLAHGFVRAADVSLFSSFSEKGLGQELTRERGSLTVFCVSLVALEASSSFSGGFILQRNLLSVPWPCQVWDFAVRHMNSLSITKSLTETRICDQYHPLLLKIFWPVTLKLFPSFAAHAHGSSGEAGGGQAAAAALRGLSRPRVSYK